MSQENERQRFFFKRLKDREIMKRRKEMRTMKF